MSGIFEADVCATAYTPYSANAPQGVLRRGLSEGRMAKTLFTKGKQPMGKPDFTTPKEESLRAYP